MALEAQGRNQGDAPSAEAGKDPVQVGARCNSALPAGGISWNCHRNGKISVRRRIVNLGAAPGGDSCDGIRMHL